LRPSNSLRTAYFGTPNLEAMASRILTSGLRTLPSASAPAARASRSFQSSARVLDALAAPALPVRKPVGAFRGGYAGPPAPFPPEGRC